MRTEQELKSLFTSYFSDRLTPAQIQALTTDVMAAQADRHSRTYPAPLSSAAYRQPEQVWSGTVA
jgi:hypothetical protein